MGWLIVPSVALAVPRTQSPAEKTGKPIRMISRLSRTVQDTTRPATPRAMHSTASTSPNGPEATAEPMSATMTSPGPAMLTALTSIRLSPVWQRTVSARPQTVISAASGLIAGSSAPLRPIASWTVAAACPSYARSSAGSQRGTSLLMCVN